MGKYENVYKNSQYDKLQLQAIKDKNKSLEEIKQLVKDCNKFNEDLEILNYINSGSCGIVYEGRIRKSVNKKVALKFILNKIQNRKNKLQEKENYQSLYKINKEITLQNKLKHKNITSLYGVYEIQNVSSCIVMELAKYGDLDYFQKKLLQQKCLSETMIGYIAKQVLNGLYYCHQSKIIHMDIKHQNILIDENLHIKLTDMSVSFSYSNYKPSSSVTLPLAGTSLFMSPEVLGKKEIKIEDCNKVDMFSFGTLVYNLAFCEYPYRLDYSDKKNFEKIKEKITKNLLIIPESKRYSQMFRNFIAKLLNTNIKERLSIEEAMKDPWMQGVELIFWEKEKIYDLEKFLIYCLIDNIKSFNDYLVKTAPN